MRDGCRGRSRKDRHLGESKLGCQVGEIGPFTTKLGTPGILGDGKGALLVPLCHLEKDTLLWADTASARAQSSARDVGLKSSRQGGAVHNLCNHWLGTLT